MGMFFGLDTFQHRGEIATHPIALLPRPLAVLLLLAGDDPASSSCLASERGRGTLGRVQLRFLGS